jgi:WD40 repeat protein
MRTIRKETNFLSVLDTPEEGVWTLAFSPDNQWLAAGTVYLWSLVDPAADLCRLDASEEGIWTLAFSPDNQWLAAGGDDSTVYLFEVSLENTAEAMCQLARRNLTRAEWRKYMPTDMEYRATCPNLPEASLVE